MRDRREGTGASAIGEGAAVPLLAIAGVLLLLVLTLANAGLGALGDALGKRIGAARLE